MLKNHEILGHFSKKIFWTQKNVWFFIKKIFFDFCRNFGEKICLKAENIGKNSKIPFTKGFAPILKYCPFFREKLRSYAYSGICVGAHFDFFGLKNVKTYASNFWKFLMAENAWKIFFHAFPYIFHEKKKQHFIYQRICAYFEMLLFFLWKI